MWLSRRFNKENTVVAEAAVVTSAKSGKTEAVASRCLKEIGSYAPYGYSSYAPSGQEILLINNGNEIAGAGVKMNGSSTLECGEIELRSLGGASICLKNDGSILINDKIILTKNGTVINIFGEEIII